MKIKKILIVLLLTLFIPNIAKANELKSFDVTKTTNEDYDIKFKVTSKFDFDNPRAFRNYPLKEYSVYHSNRTYYNGELVIATFRWEDPDYIIKTGEQYVNLICETLDGKKIVYTLYLYGMPNEVEEREALAAEEMAEQEAFPTTLTVNSLLLSLDTAYDINLNDKITGSKYTWSSSNEKVAKVNTKNGVVTAISEGTAIITCYVTTPDGVEKQLTSNVTVGTDDNFPMLTETILDLSIADTFDINLENKITKSTYKWTSSDRSVAKVNSSNGVVTAIGEGAANIYCTVTAPDNQIIVLVCEVNVTE